MIKNNLRKIRQKQLLSQDRLAEKSGVCRNTISSIERGSVPSVHIALLLSQALECSVEDMFCCSHII